MINDDGDVVVSKEGSVGIITIDRPAKLNAMTVDMDRKMNEIVFSINQDDSIRTVVLRGSGDRAFCVGSDINDLDQYGDNWRYRNRFDARLDYARAIWLCRKPVIASIQGYCIGGGLEMACASDIRIAGEGAVFGAGEIKWGWHGGSGATQLLSRIVGAGYAARMLMTGDPIDASIAEKIGLVEELVGEGESYDRAMELATTIADRAPIAVQRIKFMLRMASNVPIEAGLLIENDSFAYCMLTADAQDGRRAFAEKRAPRVVGK